MSAEIFRRGRIEPPRRQDGQERVSQSESLGGLCVLAVQSLFAGEFAVRCPWRYGDFWNGAVGDIGFAVLGAGWDGGCAGEPALRIGHGCVPGVFAGYSAGEFGGFGEVVRGARADSQMLLRDFEAMASAMGYLRSTVEREMGCGFGGFGFAGVADAGGPGRYQGNGRGRPGGVEWGIGLADSSDQDSRAMGTGFGLVGEER